MTIFERLVSKKHKSPPDAVDYAKEVCVWVCVRLTPLPPPSLPLFPPPPCPSVLLLPSFFAAPPLRRFELPSRRGVRSSVYPLCRFSSTHPLPILISYTWPSLPIQPPQVFARVKSGESMSEKLTNDITKALNSLKFVLFGDDKHEAQQVRFRRVDTVVKLKIIPRL
jgi:hypothetical protein